jgi:hypothetical protein
MAKFLLPLLATTGMLLVVACSDDPEPTVGPSSADAELTVGELMVIGRYNRSNYDRSREFSWYSAGNVTDCCL